jgi:MFS family permease
VTLPLLAKFTFNGGAGLYSAFLAAMGAGAVCGGLFTAHRSRPSQKMLALIGMIFGTLILALAFSPTKTLAVVILVPMGAASISFIATNNSILQLRSEPSMRGRVMSLNAIAFLGSTPIGAPLLGWISDMTNPRVSLMVGGAATLAASVPLVLYATKGDRVRRGIVTVDEEVVAEEGGEMVVLPLPQPVNLSGQRRLG